MNYIAWYILGSLLIVFVMGVIFDDCLFDEFILFGLFWPLIIPMVLLMCIHILGIRLGDMIGRR